MTKIACAFLVAIGCAAADDFIVPPGTVTGTTVHINHDTITAGAVIVAAPSGNLTLDARAWVVLQPGFTVQTGGRLQIRVVPQPSVSFTAAASSGAESVGGVLTVTLSIPFTQTVTVPFTVSGTATNPADHTRGSGTLTFAAGVTSQTIPISVVNDTLDEANETIVVTLGTPTNATLGAATVHTYTITDDDAAPTVAFTVGSSTSAESVAAVTLTVNLSAASGQTVTVPFTVTGTATGGGTDFSIAASPLTFAAGTTSRTIAITVVNDTLDEPNETIVVTLGAPTNATLGTTTAHTSTITDDDATPTVAFAAASSSGAEATAAVNLTVTLSAASGQTVTVPFTVTGTATNPADHNRGNGTLTFNAGTTSQAVAITVVNDTLDEPDETIVVTLGAPTNATLGATTAHTYTITDDDATPTVAFAVSASQGSEVTAAVSLTVALSAASGQTVTVPFTITGTATGVDFSASASPVTFAAGITSQTIALTVVNDTGSEGNETVIVTLGTPTNATPGAITAHTYTILDDDSTRTVAFAVATSSGSESMATVNLAVNLSAAFGKAVTVPFTVTGSATGGGTDHTLANGSLSFAIGDVTRNVIFTVVNDVVDEPNETVIVTLGTPTNATLGATTVHTYTITDDDAPPTVAFTGGTSSGAESATTVTLTVNLSAASTQIVTVPFTVTGTAANPADHNRGNGTLTFNPGVTSQTIAITVVNDTIDEADETVVVTLTAPTNATLGAIPAHTYTITDDDAAPTAVFAAATSTGVESVAAISLTVNLSAASGQTVTVPFTVTGTALRPADHDLANGSLTFFAGVASQTIAFTVVNDTSDEPSETVIVTLGTPTNATLGSTTTHTYTITDDDSAPTVAFAVSVSSGSEAATTAALTVNLSVPSAMSVSVPFSVSTSSTATGGGIDFTAPTGPVLFAPGETTKVIALTVNNDIVVESSETVIVTLGTPSNATLGTPATHTYTIVDDDGVAIIASFASAGQAVNEAAATISIPVQLDRVSPVPIVVGLLVEGTASSGADFTAPTATITIPANTLSANVQVPVLVDAFGEPDETVVIHLVPGLGYAVGATNIHTLTIRGAAYADTVPTVFLLDSAATLAEGAAPGFVNARVGLSYATFQDVVVPLTITGTAGPDDRNLPTSVTIPAGQTRVDVGIDVSDDDVVEGAETVVVTIDATDPAPKVDPLMANVSTTARTFTLTITDNDQLAPPVVGFVKASISDIESTTAPVIAVTLSRVAPGPISVSVTATPLTAQPSDFTLTTTTLSFATGEQTKTLLLAVQNDSVSEPDETFQLTLSNPLGATFGTSTLTYTILNDDPDKAVALQPPLIVPNGGAFLSPQAVDILPQPGSAEAWFTTDGSTPVPGTGTAQKFTTAFTRSTNTTVKAVSAFPVGATFASSGVAQAVFTFFNPSSIVTPGTSATGTTGVMVSPYCFEVTGVDAALKATALSLVGGKDFAAGTPYRIAEQAVFANMALSAAGVDTTLRLTVGGSAKERTVKWNATDLRGKTSANRIVIRTGDSLLWTVTGSGTRARIIQDAAKPQSAFDLAVGQTLPTVYTVPGELVTIAQVDGGEVGRITVVVVEAKFPAARLAAPVNQTRPNVKAAITPGSAVGNVTIASADPAALTVSSVTPSGSDISFSVRPLKRGLPMVVARTPDINVTGTAPIVAFAEVEEFEAICHGAIVQQGSSRGHLVVEPFVPNLKYTVEGPAGLGFSVSFGTSVGTNKFDINSDACGPIRHLVTGASISTIPFGMSATNGTHTITLTATDLDGNIVLGGATAITVPVHALQVSGFTVDGSTPTMPPNQESGTVLVPITSASQFYSEHVFRSIVALSPVPSAANNEYLARLVHQFSATISSGGRDRINPVRSLFKEVRDGTPFEERMTMPSEGQLLLHLRVQSVKDPFAITNMNNAPDSRFVIGLAVDNSGRGVADNHERQLDFLFDSEVVGIGDQGLGQISYNGLPANENVRINARGQLQISIVTFPDTTNGLFLYQFNGDPSYSVPITLSAGRGTATVTWEGSAGVYERADAFSPGTPPTVTVEGGPFLANNTNSFTSPTGGAFIDAGTISEPTTGGGTKTLRLFRMTTLGRAAIFVLNAQGPTSVSSFNLRRNHARVNFTKVNLSASPPGDVFSTASLSASLAVGGTSDIYTLTAEFAKDDTVEFEFDHPADLSGATASRLVLTGIVGSSEVPRNDGGVGGRWAGIGLGSGRNLAFWLHGGMDVQVASEVYQTAALGPDLSLALSSFSDLPTELGPGWRTNYDQQIMIARAGVGEGNINSGTLVVTSSLVGLNGKRAFVLIDERGHASRFDRLGNAIESSPYRGARIVEKGVSPEDDKEPKFESGERFKLIRHDNSVAFFNEEGWLVRLRVINGEILRVDRASDYRGKAISVTDEHGRKQDLQRAAFGATFESTAGLAADQQRLKKFDRGMTGVINVDYESGNEPRMFKQIKLDGKFTHTGAFVDGSLQYDLTFDSKKRVAEVKLTPAVGAGVWSRKVTYTDDPTTEHPTSIKVQELIGSQTAGVETTYTIGPLLDPVLFTTLLPAELVQWKESADTLASGDIITTTRTFQGKTRLVNGQTRGRLIERFAYDGVGNLVQHVRQNRAPVTNDLVQTWRYTNLRDQNDQMVGANLEAESRVHAVTGVEGSGGVDLVTTTRYVASGRAAGKPESVSDPCGATETYAYSDKGFLASRVDARGKTWLYQDADAHGNIRRVSAPSGVSDRESSFQFGNHALTALNDRGLVQSSRTFGRTTITNYDVRQRPIEIIPPSAKPIKTKYDASDLSVEIIDELGRKTESFYDALGRQTKVKVTSGTADAAPAGGPAITTPSIDDVNTTYNLLGTGWEVVVTHGTREQSRRSVDFAGRPRVDTVKRSQVNGASALTDCLTSYSYTQGNGLLSQIVDERGKVWPVENDDLGQRTRTSSPVSADLPVVTTYNAVGWVLRSAQGERVSSATFDACGRTVKSVNPAGGWVQSTYDAGGLTVAQRPRHHIGSTFEFDSDGVPTASVDQRGKRTTMTVNASTIVHQVVGKKRTVTHNFAAGTGFPTATSTPLGAITYVPREDGSVRTATQQGRGESGTFINGFGQPTLASAQVEMKSGGVQRVYSKQAYQDNTGLPGDSTSPLNLVTRPTFDTTVPEINATSDDVLAGTQNATAKVVERDAAGNVTKTQDGEGAPGTANRVSTTVYDDAGRVSRSISPGTVVTTVILRNGFGEPVTITQNALAPATRTYDLLGNVVASSDPDTLATSCDYDAMGRQLRCSVGRETTEYVYDLITGDLTDQFLPGDKRVHYERDQDGSVLTTTHSDRSGTKDVAKWTWTRDELGRVTTVLGPNLRRETVEYNEVGDVKATVDRSGRKQIVVREPTTGRVQQIRFPDAPGETITIDQDFASTSGARSGLVQTTTFASQAAKTTTDRRGRTVLMELPGQAAQSFSFNKASQLLTQGGQALGYDAASGLLSSFAQAGATITLASGDYVDGRTKTLRLPNGVVRTMSYTAAGRVLTMSQVVGTVTEQYAYTYDRQARLVRLARTDGGSTDATAWTYDGSGRIRSEVIDGGTTDPAAQVFAHDARDNRVAEERFRGDQGNANHGTRTFAFDGTHTQADAISSPVGTWTIDTVAKNLRAQVTTGATAPSARATLTLPSSTIAGPLVQVRVTPVTSGLVAGSDRLWVGVRLTDALGGNPVLVGAELAKSGSVVTATSAVVSLSGASPVVLARGDLTFTYTVGSALDVQVVRLPNVDKTALSSALVSARLAPAGGLDLGATVSVVAASLTQGHRGVPALEIRGAFAAAATLDVRYDDLARGAYRSDTVQATLSDIDGENQLLAVTTRNQTGIRQSVESYFQDANGLTRSRTKQVLDAVGTVTRTERTEYEYDRLDRLVRVLTAAADAPVALPAATPQVTFGYHSTTWMRATLTPSGGPSTLFTWDGRNLLSQQTGGGAVTSFATFGGSPLWEKTGTSSALTYAQDGRGNITGLIGGVTTPAVGTDYVRKFSYDAFGGLTERLRTVVGSTVTYPAVASTARSLGPRYRGQYFDAPTGDYYLRHRYYQPGVGRFLTVDPARAGGNWYGYCGGDPVNRSDPSGLRAIVANDAGAEFDQWYRKNSTLGNKLRVGTFPAGNEGAYYDWNFRWNGGLPTFWDSHSTFSEITVDKEIDATQINTTDISLLAAILDPDKVYVFDKNGWRPSRDSDQAGVLINADIQVGKGLEDAGRPIANALAAVGDAAAALDPLLIPLTAPGAGPTPQVATGVNFVANAGRGAASLVGSLRLLRTSRLVTNVEALTARVAPRLSGARSVTALDDSARTTARIPHQLGNIADLGQTDMLGNIVLQRGLTGRVYTETLRHEAVHRWLSPLYGPIGLREARGALKWWGYNKSHFLKYTEEALAEMYATRSIADGLRFPLQGYGVSFPRVLAEGAGYGALVSGATYGSYRIGQSMATEDTHSTDNETAVLQGLRR